MTKGASSWRMQLPPLPQQEGAADDTNCRGVRAPVEKIDRKKNFRESVALAIAPNMSLLAAVQQHRGCEVDIVHEGCCTVRFDTLAPHVTGNAEAFEKSAELEANGSENPPRANGGSEEPGKQPTRKPQKIVPKPIVLQSTLPLPPQSELYFEVEFVSLQSQVMKPHTWSDISHVTVGVAPRPYPQQHLPGVLSHSCSISTSGAVHVGSPEAVLDVSPLVEGDVLGLLLCRRSGTVLFLLNGAPLKSVGCKDILLCETDPSTFTAPAGSVVEQRKVSGPDMYVTLGLIGRGECEVNFGGKSYTAHGYIRDIGGGIIQSTAPIQARAFGQRLANFSQMLAELQLFYQIYSPHMLPKAKGMVVMNVSRREAFEAELAANYGKSLKDVRAIVEDVLKRKLYNFLALHDPSRLLEVDQILQTTKGEIERINALLSRVYHDDLTGVSLRRKQSIGRMLREYHTLQKVDIDATKLDRLAEEALQNPAAVDNFLRDKYGKGINTLLQKRLEQIYEAYAPENKSEIGRLLQKYPLFDDEYHMACKLKVKYNLDLYMFSPLEEDKKEIAAIRRSLRPAKMNKELNLLESEDFRNTPAVLTDNEGNRTPGASSRRSRTAVEARERKSIRRASRAAADMVAAVAAATAAAHAAENAAAAAAAAAENVKEHGMNREKMREQREARRKERDERRKSRLDKEALRDLLEMQLRQQAEEEAAAETALHSHAGQKSKETQRLLEQKQQVQQKRIDIEEKKKAVESALKIPDQEWWDAMKQQEEQSDEEWEAFEKQQQDQPEQPQRKSSSSQGATQANGAALAAGAEVPHQAQAHNTSGALRPLSAATGEGRKVVRLSNAAAEPGHVRNTDAGRPGSTRGVAPVSSLKNSGAVAASAAGSRSLAGQQPERQKCDEQSQEDAEEPSEEEEGTTGEKDVYEHELPAPDSADRPRAPVALGTEDKDEVGRRARDARAAAGDATPNETAQHGGVINESSAGARDHERNKSDDGHKGRVSFAAARSEDEVGSGVGVREGRSVAGEAKSVVDDIVRRSSAMAIDGVVTLPPDFVAGRNGATS